MVVCTLLRAHFTPFRIEDAQYATNTRMEKLAFQTKFFNSINLVNSLLQKAQ
jgi:hypothetical protein